ncbi:MAG: hypothetical protein AAGH45_00910 [Pseudomonadota bacterium]
MRQGAWGLLGRVLALGLLLAATLGVGAAHAQEAPPETDIEGEAILTPEEIEAQQAEAAAIADSLEAIDSILQAQAEKRKQREALRTQLNQAQNEVDEEAAKAALSAVDTELEQLNAQVEGLATGVSLAEVEAEPREFNLNTELQGLIQPFLLMLKSSTENARAIAQLDQDLTDAERDQQVAIDALARLQPMLDAAPETGAVRDRLELIRETWEVRQNAANDATATLKRQLEIRREAQVRPGATVGSAFTSFVRERGRNLIVGMLVFIGVIALFRLVRTGMFSLLGTQSRGFPARLGGLLLDCGALIAAFAAILAVFNAYNDWVLTGVTLLLLLALGWLVLRSLPTLVEQVTLLLNLGAVQEGERVVVNGVPWLVKRLDLYTDLENPDLRGGTFTVPARELTGLHSRPLAQDEVWFPTREGDWVLLGDEVFGEVIFQSPEMVQIREEGGAVISYPIGAFMDEKPKNLSLGFRATISFGLDYRHQADAVSTIPQTLRAHLKERLPTIIDPRWIRMVDAVFVSAGESALEYDLEGDFTGEAAPRYEDIKEALAKFAVECSESQGWSIPFPQLTVHSALT